MEELFFAEYVSSLFTIFSASILERDSRLSLSDQSTVKKFYLSNFESLLNPNGVDFLPAF